MYSLLQLLGKLWELWVILCRADLFSDDGSGMDTVFILNFESPQMAGQFPPVELSKVERADWEQTSSLPSTLEDKHRKSLCFNIHDF